jgi:type III pantothenate kinase
MELILDFGNTCKKIALFDHGDLVFLQQHPEITLEIIEDFIKDHPGISSCILSSVIHHTLSINEFLVKRFPLWILDSQTPLPIRNDYKTPETLGKDRLAAAVAGALRFPGKPVLVINAGTAITYDFIKPSGEYLGGAISPGMQMRFTALHTFTGKLPLVVYKESIPLLGKDTENSILSGVINGIVGEMEGFATHYNEQYPDLNVILSGGDLNYFVKRLKINIFAVTNIVLTGLHQILLFNVNKTP